MSDQFIISQEEAGELRKAIRDAMRLLEYVGNKLGATPAGELRHFSDENIRTQHLVSFRGLRAKIVALLAQANRPLRSVDIADALWERNMGVTRDRFTRRVIVNISAMYKEGGRGIKKIELPDSRETLWALEDLAFSPDTASLSTPLESSETNTTILPSRAT